MVKSEVHKGLIYAGDTPLASTIAVEQTGPLQLTVRAGPFTSTGQAAIRDYDPAVHDSLIADGKAEKLPYGKRVRIWLQNADGTILEKAATYVLAADEVFDLTADPLGTKEYAAELGIDARGEVRVLLLSRVLPTPFPASPGRWRKLHDVIFPFRLPPSTVDLGGLPIYVLTVKPGFPPGTGPKDWLVQRGTIKWSDASPVADIGNRGDRFPLPHFGTTTKRDVRVRFLVTNGLRSKEIAWLEHRGSDVYWGPVGSEVKFSYHGSGARHMKGPGFEERFEANLPLSELKGSFSLGSLGFDPRVVVADVEPPGPPRALRKADATVVLDLRTMPSDRSINIMIGLLEPGQLGAVLFPQDPFTVGQVLVVTTVKPWVYALQAWG